MFSSVCFAIALGFVAIFACLARRNRNNMTQCISCILLGIFFSTFFMVLPTQWVGEGKLVCSEPLYTGLSTLFYSLKSLGGGQDLSQLETMQLPGLWKGIYIVLNYIFFTLAPILTSTLLLSFIGDTDEKMRLFLRRSKKFYVFSEINENALALAGGIQRQPGRKTLIFCNTKDTDKALIAQAKKLGGIALYKQCTALKLRRRKTYDFFLICANEDRNMQLAEAMIVRHAHCKNTTIRVNAFVESGTNVNFLEHMHKNKGNPNMELRCIDEIALLCNHLIYTHPLFDTKGSATISVAIVGCGRTGMRMLKTAYWAGQVDGYQLKIRVYDKDADYHREEFYNQCPDLVDDPAIQFINADVSAHTFRQQLLAPENSGDATCIVVAMGSDQLNLSIADEMYRIYRRHTLFREDRMPEIFARIRSQEKSAPYLDNPAFLENRHIHLFGTTASVFSDKTLFDTDLENLAFAVHMAYEKALELDKDTPAYKKLRKDFQTSEYFRRSSMAAALHIPAKLHMCGDLPQKEGNLLTAENIQFYADQLARNESLAERLAVNEHARWNAFLRSEGYQTATTGQMHLYAQAVDSHADKLSMLHPCITDWDQLDEIQSLYNTTYGKDENFKKSDRDIVKKVPEIWAFAQKMKGGDR